MSSKTWGIPLLALAIMTIGTLYLVSQDRVLKVNTQGVPVGQPTVAAGPPKATTGGEITAPGGIIRSLDKINAAAAAVGCDTLKPDDPAGKLLDVSECLGEQAMKSAPGRK